MQTYHLEYEARCWCCCFTSAAKFPDRAAQVLTEHLDLFPSHTGTVKINPVRDHPADFRTLTRMPLVIYGLRRPVYDDGQACLIDEIR